jgi:hypothetical protein
MGCASDADVDAGVGREGIAQALSLCSTPAVMASRVDITTVSEEKKK